MKKLEKKITSLVGWFKEMMGYYEEMYRYAYKDPYFIMVEGRTSGYGMF